jgi:hypothetical protein
LHHTGDDFANYRQLSFRCPIGAQRFEISIAGQADDNTIIAAGALDDSSPAMCRKVVG